LARALAAVASLFFVCFSAYPASAKVLEPFNVAGWDGGAYSSDNSGLFTHCAMSASYNSGILLLFSVTKEYEWSMGLGNPSWQFTIGNKYPVTYSIDGGQWFSATAEAVTTSAVRIDLPARSDVFDRFRYGSVLHVQAAARSFTFNLTGTNQALTALVACSNRWVAATNRPQTNDPFAAPSAAPTVGAVQDNSAEAVTLASNILSASGIAGFSVQTGDDAARLLRGYDAVWTAPNLLGAIRVFPDSDPRDIDGITAALTSKEAQDCKGKFASSRLPVPAGAEGVVLARLAIACDQTSSAYYGYYTVLFRKKGGTYLSLVGGLRNPEGEVPAQQADESIQRAVYTQHGTPSQN